MNRIDSLLKSGGGYCRIDYGTRTGTSTYGSSNPCSMTFNITPYIFFMHPYSGDNHHIAYGYTPPSRTSSYVGYGACVWLYSNSLGGNATSTQYAAYKLYTKRSGKTIYWYSTFTE
jgi:hypothetical protein